MKLNISLVAAFVVLCTGCATTRTTTITNADGTTTTTTATVDMATTVANVCAVAAPLIEGTVRASVPLVLANNPELEDEFTAINTVAAAIVCATDPTANGFTTAVQAAFPDLDAASAKAVGVALESAYRSAAALYKTQTGETLQLSALYADSAYRASVQTLVDALIKGVGEGISDYTSNKTATSN